MSIAYLKVCENRKNAALRQPDLRSHLRLDTHPPFKHLFDICFARSRGSLSLAVSMDTGSPLADSFKRIIISDGKARSSAGGRCQKILRCPKIPHRCPRGQLASPQITIGTSIGDLFLPRRKDLLDVWGEGLTKRDSTWVQIAALLQ